LRERQRVDDDRQSREHAHARTHTHTVLLAFHSSRRRVLDSRKTYRWRARRCVDGGARDTRDSVASSSFIIIIIGAREKSIASRAASPVARDESRTVHTRARSPRVRRIHGAARDRATAWTARGGPRPRDGPRE